MRRDAAYLHLENHLLTIIASSGEFGFKFHKVLNTQFVL
jgi:hypothetical protein